MVEEGRGRSRVETWLPDAAAWRRRTWPWRDWIWLDRLSRAADSLAAWLTAQVVAELARSHFLAWIAVAFGAGIAAYFAAEREPSLWAALPAAFVFVTLAVMARRTRYFHALAMVAAIAAGFATATAKTARIDHPVLTSPVFSVTLAGFVESREERERSDRFVLRVSRFEPARSTDAAQAVGEGQRHVHVPPLLAERERLEHDVALEQAGREEECDSFVTGHEGESRPRA